MQVIDESQILVHNGQQSSQFQQGTNDFFTVTLFSQYLELDDFGCEAFVLE